MDLHHHSLSLRPCVSSSNCTLYPLLTESVHKTSPCHLYKHRTEDGQDGSRPMKVQPVGRFASDMAVIILLGVLQGILVHHFGSGGPEK